MYMQASNPRSRLDLPHDAVEVGVVVEAEPAGVVDDLHPAVDLRVVDPHVVGLLNHERGRPLRDGGLERIQRRVAVLLERQRDDLEAGRGGGGGVARMRLDGRDDLVAPTELTARRVVGARDHRVRVGGVGAAAGLEHELIHPGHSAQEEIQPVDELEHALKHLVFAPAALVLRPAALANTVGMRALNGPEEWARAITLESVRRHL
jgi:hypothetical protein